MNELKAIECFISVAQTGSFSQAAENLRKPVSSVSRQVTALETELKAALFHRSTRQVRLTEIGHFYLQECLAITDHLKYTREQVISYQGEPSGTLTISSMPSFGERILVPLIEQFQSAHPRVVIEADFTDEVQDLTLKDIDICFRGGPLPDKRLIAHRVMDNNFYLCASPEYLHQHGIPYDLEELETHKGIYYRDPKGKMTWWVNDVQGYRPAELEPAVITNSSSLLLNHALQGKGLCLLPMWALKPHIDVGSLIYIDMKNPPRINPDSSMGIYLLYQHMRYQVPKIKSAVDFFREKLIALQTDIEQSR